MKAVYLMREIKQMVAEKFLLSKEEMVESVAAAAAAAILYF